MRKSIGLIVLICFTSGLCSAQSGIDSIISKMSLREKVGQLFITEYSPGVSNEKKTERLIRKDKIGGIILMECDIDAYATALNHIQSISHLPLCISVDGEWGAAMRFDTLTAFPRNMQMGALREPDLVYKVGRSMATQFVRMGIHINYAPSVDVNNNPANPVIGARSFGDDREKVAVWGAALMRGLNDGGVIGSAKHFPGHGDTETDSHKSLPVLPFSRKRLDSLELYPFQMMIKEGSPMVMIGHLNIPALDSSGTPSSLSYPVITDLLKNEMGFGGIVITDALAMRGVANYAPILSIPALSFMAGADLLLMPPSDPHSCIKYFRRCVRKGEIPMERIDQSLRKMLEMKRKLGILYSSPYIPPTGIFEDVETASTLSLIREVCEASVTLIKAPSFADSLSTLEANGDAISLHLSPRIDRLQLEEAKKMAQGKEYAVVYLPGFRAQKNARELFSAISPDEVYDFLNLWAKEQKIVLAIMDSPYVLNKISWQNFDGVIVGYSNTVENSSAVEKVVKGIIPSRGVLPVAAGGLESGFGL